MSIEREKIFFHDLLQEDVTFGDLVEMVCGRDASFIPVLRTRSIAEVFCAIVQAYAYEQDVTLLDHDVLDEEVMSVVGDLEAVNQRKALTREDCPRSVEELIERVLQSEAGTVKLFTSGTTGRPKHVIHRLETLARGVRRSPATADNVWGFAYNPTHMAGVQVFLQAFLNGNCIVNLFGYPPSTVLDTILDYTVTHISATPTFYRQLLPTDRIASCVRRVTIGGERFDDRTVVRLKRLFPNARFLNIYASTEAGSLFASEGDTFHISKEQSQDYRIQNNQLYIHRYLLGKFDVADEWYATGDVVEVVSDDPLRFRFVRRECELVNVGGYMVNPHEIEAILSAHAGIRDAHVYSTPNPVVGNVMLADVVSADPCLNEPQLREYLSSRLQPYKIPRMIRFVSELELTRSGKKQR